MARHTRNIDRGFTLIESLIAAVILAVSVGAIASSLLASQQQTQEQQDSGIANSLARELMEEIVAVPMTLPTNTTNAPGWPSVTNRALYDTVDDFNGYKDVVTTTMHFAGDATFTTARPPATIVSVAPTLGRDDYYRLVTITYPTTIGGNTVPAGDFALVTVTITSADNTPVKLYRLMSKKTVVR